MLPSKPPQVAKSAAQQPLSLWSGLLLATLAALCIAAPSFRESLWPLTWVALVPLFVALRHSSAKRAFLLGWWMETLITWVAFHWLVGTMVRFGYIPMPLSLMFFGIIGIGNGIRLGLFTWWLRITAADAGPWWYQFLLPPCAYVMLDYLYPRVFPWGLGVTQLGAPALIQIADLTGVHGITFLLVACSVAVSAFLPLSPPSPAATRWRMGFAVVLLLGLTLAYGAWRTPHVRQAMQQASALRLALIQPNIGIDEKGSRDSRDAHLYLQAEMSRATLTQQPDLIIWPETMYPYAIPVQADRLVLPQFDASSQPHWLIGALAYNTEGPHLQRFNSAFLVSPDTTILGRYDKQRLLAFGEYIPLQRYFPFLRNISPTIGNLTPGAGGLVTLPNGPAIGPLVCYEDILPALGRQAVQQGAAVLVNLTNNAWFGQSRAPYQHRLLAAFRAIENRVYLVRVTNTGLTSIIDPLGHEQALLPTDEQESLVHTIQPLRLATFYTRFGDVFAQLCTLTALLLPLWRKCFQSSSQAW
jgi:apolipoprotein N-acyltransferase